MSNTACVYNYKFSRLGRLCFRQPCSDEKLSYLLAFVLVDLATKGKYGKSAHNMIQSILDEWP